MNILGIISSSGLSARLFGFIPTLIKSAKSVFINSQDNYKEFSNSFDVNSDSLYPKYSSLSVIGLPGQTLYSAVYIPEARKYYLILDGELFSSKDFSSADPEILSTPGQINGTLNDFNYLYRLSNNYPVANDIYSSTKYNIKRDFLAFSDSASIALGRYSHDFDTMGWTTVPTPFARFSGTGFQFLELDDSLLAADGRGLSRSTDLLSWTTVAQPLRLIGSEPGAAFGSVFKKVNNKYYSWRGGSSSEKYHSTDGITWTTFHAAVGFPSANIISNSDNDYVLGLSNNNYYSIFKKSTDGITWTTHGTVPASIIYGNIVFDEINNQYWINVNTLSNNRYATMYSKDLLNWTTHSTEDIADITSVALFIKNNLLFTSKNYGGSNPVISLKSNEIKDIDVFTKIEDRTDKTNLVATSNSGTIYKSIDDGVSWTSAQKFFSGTRVFGDKGGSFVGGQSLSNLKTSTDLASWSDIGVRYDDIYVSDTIGSAGWNAQMSYSDISERTELSASPEQYELGAFASYKNNQPINNLLYEYGVFLDSLGENAVFSIKNQESNWTTAEKGYSLGEIVNVDNYIPFYFNLFQNSLGGINSINDKRFATTTTEEYYTASIPAALSSTNKGFLLISTDLFNWSLPPQSWSVPGTSLAESDLGLFKILQNGEMVIGEISNDAMTSSYAGGKIWIKYPGEPYSFVLLKEGYNPGTYAKPSVVSVDVWRNGIYSATFRNGNTTDGYMMRNTSTMPSFWTTTAGLGRDVTNSIQIGPSETDYYGYTLKSSRLFQSSDGILWTSLAFSQGNSLTSGAAYVANLTRLADNVLLDNGKTLSEIAISSNQLDGDNSLINISIFRKLYEGSSLFSSNEYSEITAPNLSGFNAYQLSYSKYEDSYYLAQRLPGSSTRTVILKRPRVSPDSTWTTVSVNIGTPMSKFGFLDNGETLCMGTASRFNIQKIKSPVIDGPVRFSATENSYGLLASENSIYKFSKIDNVNFLPVVGNTQIKKINQPVFSLIQKQLGQSMGRPLYANSIYGYSNSAHKIVVSTDLSSWTTVGPDFSGTTQYAEQLFYFNDTWFIFYPGGYSARSSDLSNWVTHRPGPYSIKYLEDIDYFIGTSGDSLSTSTDLISWTTVGKPTLSAGQNVRYSYLNGIWGCFARTNGYFRSTNAISWTTIYPLFGSAARFFESESEYWVATFGGWSDGRFPDGRISQFYRSTDALSWQTGSGLFPMVDDRNNTQEFESTSRSLFKINDLYYVGTSNILYYSTDALSWQSETNIKSESLENTPGQYTLSFAATPVNKKILVSAFSRNEQNSYNFTDSLLAADAVFPTKAYSYDNKLFGSNSGKIYKYDNEWSLASNVGIDGNVVSVSKNDDEIHVGIGLPMASAISIVGPEIAATNNISASLTRWKDRYLASYVKTDSGGLTIYPSTDGVHWDKNSAFLASGPPTFGQTADYTNPLNYGPWYIKEFDKFIANSPNPYLRTSTDLITWTDSPFSGPRLESSSGFSSVKYGGGRVVIIQDTTSSSSSGYTSTDLVSWTTLSILRNAFDVEYGDGNWVAAGDRRSAWKSTNGISWTTLPFTNALDSNPYNSVSYGSGIWTVSGKIAGIQVSTDTVSWTTRTDLPFANTNLVVGIKYFETESQWILYAHSEDLAFDRYILTSTDFVTWTTTFTPNDFAKLSGVGPKAVKGSTWVMSDGAIFMPTYSNKILRLNRQSAVLPMSSTDMKTWTSSVTNGIMDGTHIDDIESIS
jgi:hypothetical protein